MQRDLVEAAQHGEHEAFEVLATSAADRLFAIARLILRDTDRAQDAVQETLIAAWRSLPTLRDPDRFDAWLRRLLTNECANLGRRHRRWSAELRIISKEPFSGDQAGTIADRDLIERAFRRLNPDQRAAIVLRYYVGLTVPEIAETLDIPLGTAKSRLHHSLETLRGALEADERTSPRPMRSSA